MKKIIKISVLISVLLLSLLLLASCTKKDAYDEVEEAGYTVSVRFDAGEGTMDSLEYFRLADVFNLENEKDTDGDGFINISLLAPDDELRGNHAIKEIDRSGYYFAGWYINPSKRVNEAGEYLDENGNVCSEEEAATMYEKRWDFSKDTLEVDPDGKYSPDEPVLTLYAAWIPATSFNIYAPAESGEYELLSTSKISVLDIPQWNKSTGELTVTKFPTIEGKTFDHAFTFAEDGTKQIITESTLIGNIDFEHGVLISDTQDIYTEWLDGKWFKIYDAKTLASKADNNSNYIICADLDFSQTAWINTPFAQGTFNGKIHGEDGKVFKFKNIYQNLSITSLSDGETAAVRGGVFKELGENAEIKNITFETVQLTVNQTPIRTPVSFGLLAGKASDNAVLENVSFTGESLIKLASMSVSTITNPTHRKVGLIFGEGDSRGIDMTAIDCIFTDAEAATLTIDIDRESGAVHFYQT